MVTKTYQLKIHTPYSMGAVAPVRGTKGLSREEAFSLQQEWLTQTSSETADPNKPGMPGVNIRALNKRYPEGWAVHVHKITG